jgi:hypothetical protein
MKTKQPDQYILALSKPVTSLARCISPIQEDDEFDFDDLPRVTNDTDHLDLET